MNTDSCAGAPHNTAWPLHFGNAANEQRKFIWDVCRREHFELSAYLREIDEHASARWLEIASINSRWILEQSANAPAPAAAVILDWGGCHGDRPSAMSLSAVLTLAVEERVSNGVDAAVGSAWPDDAVRIGRIGRRFTTRDLPVTADNPGVIIDDELQAGIAVRSKLHYVNRYRIGAALSGRSAHRDVVVRS